jgi:hypothetical protein
MCTFPNVYKYIKQSAMIFQRLPKSLVLENNYKKHTLIRETKESLYVYVISSFQNFLFQNKEKRLQIKGGL